jgi:hypothetical protein
MAGSVAERHDLAPAHVIDRGVLPTADVVARVHRIQEVMKALMKDGVHYGKIPGTPKPTLYKPGAELLLMTFRIAAAPSQIEDLATPDEIRYRITVRGTNQVTGEVVGEMSGECSSNEEKYRWRKPVCDEEFEDTPADRRREKWMKGDGKPWKQRQVRTSPADVANTILKMAIKRALIAMTLVTLGASDIFAQDLEDLAEELRESVAGDDKPRETKQQPQRKSQSTKAESKPTEKGQFVIGVVEKVWRPKDKKFFAIKVKGDDRLFTQWIDKGEELEAAAKQFVGTDHKVKLAYVENEKDGQKYFNASGIAIADAEPATTTTVPEPVQQAVTAADIFGSPAERDPGAEG